MKPERQRELEGGVDIEALSGRLRVELTGYSRKSSDALLLAPFAASVGAGAVGGVGSAYANIGSVTNKGLEGLFSIQPISRDKISLDLTFNGSMNVNKLVAIGPNTAPGLLTIVGGDSINAFSGLRNRVGYPLLGSWRSRFSATRTRTVTAPRAERSRGGRGKRISARVNRRGSSPTARRCLCGATRCVWACCSIGAVDTSGTTTPARCFIFFQCLAATTRTRRSDQARPSRSSRTRRPPAGSRRVILPDCAKHRLPRGCRRKHYEPPPCSRRILDLRRPEPVGLVQVHRR